MTEPRPNKSDEGVQDPTISALYRRSGDLQPPAHLDEAVLGEARRALRRRSRRWILPLSTAAVLVIGVGLVLRIAVQPEFGPHPAGVPGTLTESAPEPKAQQAPPPANRRLQADDAASPLAKPQAASPREFSAESLQEEPAAPQRARKKASAAPSGAPEAEMGRSLEKAVPRLAPDELPQAAETPELWLTRIRELLSAGRRAEAKAQLAALLRQYPDYPIPEELRELR